MTAAGRRMSGLSTCCRREAAGDRIEHLKKTEMAAEAEALLTGSGWLPEPLRTPGRAAPEVAASDLADPASTSGDAVGEEKAANGQESAVVESEELAEGESVALETLATAAE